jgi:hypothetical protein
MLLFKGGRRDGVTHADAAGIQVHFGFMQLCHMRLGVKLQIAKARRFSGRG